MTTSATKIKTAPRTTLTLDDLRSFIEDEADLLDEQRFDDWASLYAEDAIYWAPAARGQQSGLTHVSLFYDDKHTMKTRIRRLNHPMIHCQDPKSSCVRVLSNFKVEWASDDGNEYRVRSKFIMIEDRPGADRRFYGGRYIHTLRREADSLQIVLKKVEITNCDQSFPMLTQPF
jgi:benzoate/toluate 1,2-dioxygenase beta subunit